MNQKQITYFQKNINTDLKNINLNIENTFKKIKKEEKIMISLYEELFVLLMHRIYVENPEIKKIKFQYIDNFLDCFIDFYDKELSDDFEYSSDIADFVLEKIEKYNLPYSYLNKKEFNFEEIIPSIEKNKIENSVKKIKNQNKKLKQNKI